MADIFYLEDILKRQENNNLIHLARISIIFNYIALETLRNFYCDVLCLKTANSLETYKWDSFFLYKNNRAKITLLLKFKKYINFKKPEDMESFIHELRVWRNLILHRSSTSNQRYNKRLKHYLENIKKPKIEQIFIKSKNCIEIMNYTMELT